MRKIAVFVGKGDVDRDVIYEKINSITGKSIDTIQEDIQRLIDMQQRDRLRRSYGDAARALKALVTVSDTQPTLTSAVLDLA